MRRTCVLVSELVVLAMVVVVVQRRKGLTGSIGTEVPCVIQNIVIAKVIKDQVLHYVKYQTAQLFYKSLSCYKPHVRMMCEVPMIAMMLTVTCSDGGRGIYGNAYNWEW